MRRPNWTGAACATLYALRAHRRMLSALLLVASSGFAAYPARDLIIPIAGRARNAAGRQFLTTVWLTNTDERSTASVTLSFFASGRANPSPRQMHLTLGAGLARPL